MRYSWETEGRAYFVYDKKLSNIQPIASCLEAFNAERIVEALNAWDRAKADVKQMLKSV